MNVRWVKTVGRAATWLHSRITSFVLLLGYHRVAQTAIDPYEMCVQPDHFAEHLDILSRVGFVTDWHSLERGLYNGDLPRRAVVLTFDDAYEDILYTTEPLLAARDLPASVFAVTGALGREFWWDRLARLIFSPAVLPDSLSIEIGSEMLTWSTRGSENAGSQEGIDGPRDSLFQELYRLLTALPAERPHILNQLEQWVETAELLPSATARSMTSTELQILNDGGLISVGSHTVTHPVLPALPRAKQYAELTNSRRTLEDVLGQPVTALSYPHGRHGPQTRRLVKEAGFRLACSSANGIVHRGQDRYALPRFWVPDWDGEEFSRWIARWL